MFAVSVNSDLDSAGGHVGGSARAFSGFFGCIVFKLLISSSKAGASVILCWLLRMWLCFIFVYKHVEGQNSVRVWLPPVSSRDGKVIDNSVLISCHDVADSMGIDVRPAQL